MAPFLIFLVFLHPFPSQLLSLDNLLGRHFLLYIIPMLTFPGNIKPLVGLYIILNNPFALIIHQAHTKLPRKISLLSCHAEPLNRLLIVL